MAPFCPAFMHFLLHLPSFGTRRGFLSRGPNFGVHYTEPVIFGVDQLGEPITEVKTDYTVYFGRRYRGVPIVGPTLGVRLDADGNIAAVMKDWRDIAGEGPTMAVFSEDEVKAKRDAKVADLPIVHKVCGYFEDPGLGWNQQTAGVGCKIVHRDLWAEDQLNSMPVEEVDLSADEECPLHGEALSAAK